MAEESTLMTEPSVAEALGLHGPRLAARVRQAL